MEKPSGFRPGLMIRFAVVVGHSVSQGGTFSFKVLRFAGVSALVIS
jgi:hypothetical protein